MGVQSRDSTPSSPKAREVVEWAEKEVEDKIVREFAKRVKEKFDAEGIIFFGSRARGEALETSDYDFIAISKKFESIHSWRRAVG
jgi:predicted nucleotidyltransferase